jgi:hypothetical protein
MFIPLLAQASPFPQDPLTILRSIYIPTLMPLSATLEPMGRYLYVGFATIMTVWYGLETALAGQGVDWAKFAKWVIVVGLGFMLVRNYYSSPLPFSDYSVCGLVYNQSTYLVDKIGYDGTTALAGRVKLLTSPTAMPSPSSFNVYGSIVYVTTNIVLTLVQFVAWFITAWGDIALIVCFVVGPLFVPFFIVPKMDFLFWGWLKATLQYAFYKVVAAVVTLIIGHLFVLFTSTPAAEAASGGVPLDATRMLAHWPVLFGMCVLCIFGLMMIPKLTSDLFSGAASTGLGGLAAAVGATRAGFSAGADAVASGAGSVASGASSAAGAATGGGDASSSGGSGDASGESRV